jgi:hypothetical protein
MWAGQTLTLPVDRCRRLYIKLVVGLLVGTALEFYDFAVYSQLGKFVGPNFFPGKVPAGTNQLVAAVLTWRTQNFMVVHIQRV